MKKNSGKFLMAAGILLCVLLFLQPLTGDVLHAIFGLLLLVLAIVHVHRNMEKLKYRKRSNQVVDWIIMIALFVLVLSGILLHPLQGMLALKMIHKLGAVIFVIGMLVHALQNRKERKK